MKRSLLFIALLAVLVPRAAALGDSGPALSSRPNAAEARFVRSIQADLNQRFPTEAAAGRAGYIRYTNADDTGAISYANLHWESADSRHPSQLWYDVHGNLLGADFSTLKTNSRRPVKWGIQPGRWSEFDAHIHYVAIDPATHKTLYDKYVMPPQFLAAGGNLQNPNAHTLVALHLVKSANDVRAIFLFPTIWDLIVWVKPNPSGAFADKNPLVTP